MRHLDLPPLRSCSAAERVRRLLARLERVCNRVTTNASILERHGDDESHHRAVPPDAVAFAHSTEEVQAIVRLCAETRTPLIPSLILPPCRLPEERCRREGAIRWRGRDEKKGGQGEEAEERRGSKTRRAANPRATRAAALSSAYRGQDCSCCSSATMAGAAVGAAERGAVESHSAP